jgi:hypothetical protein
MYGMSVCRLHGGAAPQTIAAAERRLQQEAASRAVEVLGLSVKVDPHTALLEELQRAAGCVAWLAEQIHREGSRRRHPRA